MLRTVAPRRFVTATRSHPDRVRLGARRYATEPQASKGSGLALPLAAGGAAGIALYLYLYGTGSVFKKPQEKSPLDPNEFKDFKLKKVEPYNHNASRFIFELPNNEASLLPVASCLVIKSSDPEALKDGKGKPIIRPYTPVSPADKEGELALLIKRYESGNASKYIHGMKPGDTLSFKGPIPKFEFKANEFENVGLIAGGSGITPMYQILTHALADKSNKTKFKLIFSNVSEADILLREEFDALKKKYPNTFDVVYVLDKPPQGWTGPSGYISPDTIKEHFAPASDKEKVKVFVCGPPPQMKAISGPKDGMKQGALGGILKELGYTEDQVFKF